jgi:hypothetical protein
MKFELMLFVKEFSEIVLTVVLHMSFLSVITLFPTFTCCCFLPEPFPFILLIAFQTLLMGVCEFRLEINVFQDFRLLKFLVLRAFARYIRTLFKYKEDGDLLNSLSAFFRALIA